MIENIPMVGLSAPALLGAVVVLILTGRLVPRSTLIDKAEECKQWREAYDLERKARALTEAQTNELLEVTKTTHSVISALFRTTGTIVRTEGVNAGDVSQKGEET